MTSNVAQLQQDLNTQFDLYVTLLQKHEETNKKVYELQSEVTHAKSKQEQTVESYQRKLQTLRDNLKKEEEQHGKMVKNLHGRIKQLQVKYDQLHIEKQKEVAKNIQYRLRFGIDTQEDIALADPNIVGGEKALIRDKEIQKHVQQNLLLIDQISSLESKNAELEQRLMGDKLAFERDTLIRQEISDKQRVNPNYRRLRFIGQAKGFDQILAWSTELDRHGLYAPIRETILEEFCIFASAGQTNILKLISLNVMRHAAKSISAVNNPPTVVKALNLCGYLLSQDIGGKASKQIIDLGAIKEIVPFLDSPNENFRIESLYVIEMLAKHGEPFDFREICNRYQVLSKASRLLQESSHTIANKEEVLKNSNKLNGVRRDDIKASLKPLMFGAEEANSCLNIFKYYLLRGDVTKLTTIKRKDIKNYSSYQIEQEKIKVHEELTFNIANVRGIEFIARAFCISHHNFKAEKQLYRDVLQMRCLAIDIMSNLSFNPQILAEIAFQGALDKVIWTYHNRFQKYTESGKENQAKHARQKPEEGYLNDGFYDYYEPDDFMADMHKSAIKFVNSVIRSSAINMLAAFDEHDIQKLVEVSVDIFNTNDPVKLQTHLETLERMVNNDDKVAHIMCKKGLVTKITEILFNISKQAADKKDGKAGALGYSEPIENEYGQLISTNYVHIVCKKIILRIYVALFSKTSYDFNLDQEMPLINPFKYFNDVSIDIMVLDLGEFQDVELIQLAFSVVEHLIIVTQANYKESDMIAYQKLLQEHGKLHDDGEAAIAESHGSGHGQQDFKSHITAEERYDVLESAMNYVQSRDSSLGHSLDDAIIGISLFCSLQIQFRYIKQFPDVTPYESGTYLDIDFNKQFLMLCDTVLHVIRGTYSPEGEDPEEMILNSNALERIQGGFGKESEFNASDELLSIIMKFLELAVQKHSAIRYNYSAYKKSNASQGLDLTDEEENFIEAVETCRLIKFLHHSEGIKFIQMAIIQQANKDYSDWILLSRLFRLTYYMASSHVSCYAIHMNNYLIENLQVCIQNGFRQKNFMEMTDFFRYATFFSWREEFQTLLSKRFIIHSWLECLKEIQCDYDTQLKQYYINKRDETKRIQQVKQIAGKNGNIKQSLDFAKYNSKVRKPRNLAGTLLEVSGSGPYGDEEPRSVESDIRHLLAFLWDLCGLETCQRIFIETRWSEGLGMIVKKLFPVYAIPVNKILFDLMENQSISNMAESHLGPTDFHEIRSKGGHERSYCDFTIPIHYLRYRKDKNNFSQGCDIMRDVGEKPETRLQKIQRKMDLTQQMILSKNSKLKVDPEETRAKVKKMQKEREKEKRQMALRRDQGELSDVRSQFSGSQQDKFDSEDEIKQRRLPLNRNNLLKIHQGHDKETTMENAQNGPHEFLDSFLKQEDNGRQSDSAYSYQRYLGKPPETQSVPNINDVQSAYSNKQSKDAAKNKRKNHYGDNSQGSPRSDISLPDIHDRYDDGKRLPVGGESGSYATGQNYSSSNGGQAHNYMKSRTKNGSSVSVKQSGSSNVQDSSVAPSGADASLRMKRKLNSNSNLAKSSVTQSDQSSSQQASKLQSSKIGQTSRKDGIDPKGTRVRQDSSASSDGSSRSDNQDSQTDASASQQKQVKKPSPFVTKTKK